MSATVQQSWLNTLFLHFIGWFFYQLFIYLPNDILFWSVAIFYAISIGIFHIVRYYHKKILSLKNTNFLTLSLIIWMTIILIGDYAVLQSIKNGLEPLDPGGIASVITNPGSGSFNSHLNLALTSNAIWPALCVCLIGFWLTVTAYLLTLFFLFLTWCYPLQGRSTEATNQETRILETRSPGSNSGMGTLGSATHSNIRNGPGLTVCTSFSVSMTW